MSRKSGQYASVVELSPAADGPISEGLVEAAYCASRENVVMLVLDPVSRPSVDRILDGIVRRHGIDMRGVAFVEPQDAKVLEASRCAEQVFASSSRFKHALSSNGIAYRPVTELLQGTRRIA